MPRPTATPAVLVGLTVAVCCAMAVRCGEQQRRDKATAAAAGEGASQYLARDSAVVTRRAVEYLDAYELRRERDALAEELKNMRVKLRRADVVASLRQEGSYEVRLETVRVVVRDTVREIPAFVDEWLTAFLAGDTLTVETRDSLTVVLHSTRRRFLWWTWKRYTGQVAVRNHNPNVRITDVE